MSQPSSTPPSGVDNTKGAVYVNGQYSTDPNDFESADKDWKWIKAMLVGSSAVNNGEGVASVAAGGAKWVDPATLEDAGRRFDEAQAMMRGIANNFRAQAKGIAGDGRAWQGPAAEAFLAKMMDIADWLEKQALRIHDGDSSSANPLPNQLGYAGNVLRWGQDTVNAIDYFYANWARPLVTDYGDGVVHISEIPAAPPIMTAAMKKVMRIVVGEYQKVKPRTLDVPPPNTGGTPTPTGPPPTPPPTVPPPTVPPVPSPSAPPNPPPGNQPPGNQPPGNPPPGNLPPGNPPPFSANQEFEPPPGGGSGGGGNDLPAPPNPPGITPPGTLPPGGTPPVPSFPTAPGGRSGPGNGQGLPGFETPPVLPVVPPTFPGVTPPGGNGGNNGGQQGSNPGGALPPTFPGGQPPGSDNNPGAVPPPTAPDFPGAGPGTGGGTGGGGVPGLPEAPGRDQPGAFPGVPVPEFPGGGAPGGGVPGGGSPGAGTPPMMPPMSPPQPNTGSTERPDSSGLVTGDPQDWELPGVPNSPEAPGGAAPGGGAGVPGGAEVPDPLPLPGAPLGNNPGIDQPGPGVPGGGAPGAGMPPMMPPMSPPQGTTGTTERPDSSGLVTGSEEDWSSAELPAVPEAPAGAAPGTPPIVPPMAPPAGSTGTPAERPRAAGLIGPDLHPWESASEATLPDDPAGTAPAVSVPAVVPPPISAAGTATRADATGPDGRAKPADDDDDHEVTVPPVLPFVVPGRRRRPERRSEAGELLSEDEPGGDPDATTRRPERAAEQAPDEEQETAAELPPDHAALVQESDDDFGSWDSEMPPWSSGDFAPDPGAERPPAARPEPEPEQRPRPRPAGQSFEKLLLDEMPIRSGGPDLTPEEAAEAERRWRIENGQESDGAEEEAEETQERRAADLLAKDDTQWGKRPDDAVDGVIG